MPNRKQNLFRLPDDQAEKAKSLIEQKVKYQHEIAAYLGINQGRISEFMNGKRKYLMVRNFLPY